jgi:peptide/nickel transport system substrate-binding protein
MDLNLLGSPAQVSAITAALPKYSYDLAAARAQMAESAHPHGFTASMETCQYGSFLDQDQVVVTELAKIGITLKLKIVSCSVWSAELYGPKTFGASFGSYHSSIVDPSGLSAYLLGSAAIPAGGLNAADYGPAPVDSLLQAGVTTSAPAARLSIYQQVLTHIADDVPYVPLYQSNAFIAFSSKFTIPPLGMDTFEFPWALDVKLA